MTSPLLKINKNLHFEEIMYRNKQAQFLWHHESCVFFDLSLGLKREPAADSADSHQRAFYSAPRIPSFAWTNWVKRHNMV